MFLRGNLLFEKIYKRLTVKIKNHFNDFNLKGRIKMKTSEGYKDVLKQKGLKNTKHRNSILQAIEKNEQPATAEQIFLTLKEQNISINLSSVYRILESLSQSGLILKSNSLTSAKALFEKNRFEHKHHLICSMCNKMFSVGGCPLEEYEKQLQENFDFEIKGHNLEIFGICKECQKSRNK